MVPYELVVAKPFYCVPAVLEMVLHRYGVINFNQDNIAEQFVINDTTQEQRKWGIVLNENSINNFFIENSIDLREDYFPINQFLDEYYMIEKIHEMLTRGHSIICGYNYSSLYGNNIDEFGHVSIITAVKNNSKSIEILDPGPLNSGYKLVDSSNLFSAIKRAKDGIWCVGKL